VANRVSERILSVGRITAQTFHFHIFCITSHRVGQQCCVCAVHSCLWSFFQPHRFEFRPYFVRKCV